MLAAFLYDRQTDRQTDGRTVADTNKGVVEVQAVRLRTNIEYKSKIIIKIKKLIFSSRDILKGSVIII